MEHYTDEIRRNIAIGESIINGRGDDYETAIMDSIANLLTLAHEKDLSIGQILTNAVGHFAASHIESMEPDDAEAWLRDELFTLTGERQFPEYAADRAILLSGHAGHVDTPEWGV